MAHRPVARHCFFRVHVWIVAFLLLAAPNARSGQPAERLDPALRAAIEAEIGFPLATAVRAVGGKDVGAVQALLAYANRRTVNSMAAELKARRAADAKACELSEGGPKTCLQEVARAGAELSIELENYRSTAPTRANLRRRIYQATLILSHQIGYEVLARETRQLVLACTAPAKPSCAGQNAKVAKGWELMVDLVAAAKAGVTRTRTGAVSAVQRRLAATVPPIGGAK